MYLEQTGAGISTSARIPDFRSPDTGLYANLARLDLPYAEAVFDMSYFRDQPLPFYTLARELYPANFLPTLTHCFLRLLHDKGLLLKLFTQNIDCLERKAGIPEVNIVEAHGSFATQSCIDCRSSFPDKEMREHIDSASIPHCNRESCNGLVKPDIVFFGEALPRAFFDNFDVPGRADLCIVMGTSLTVQPFASLPDLCAESVPRVLMNKEAVGSLGARPNDVVCLGECDDSVRELAKACGWTEELEAVCKTVNPALIESRSNSDESLDHVDREAGLASEIEKLTRDIDKTLHESVQHQKAAGREYQAQSRRFPGRVSNLSHVFPHLGVELE